MQDPEYDVQSNIEGLLLLETAIVMDTDDSIIKTDLRELYPANRSTWNAFSQKAPCASIQESYFELNDTRFYCVRMKNLRLAEDLSEERLSEANAGIIISLIRSWRSSLNRCNTARCKYTHPKGALGIWVLNAMALSRVECPGIVTECF